MRTKIICREDTRVGSEDREEDSEKCIDVVEVKKGLSEGESDCIVNLDDKQILQRIIKVLGSSTEMTYACYRELCFYSKKLRQENVFKDKMRIA
jgi:hypothetical protein